MAKIYKTRFLNDLAQANIILNPAIINTTPRSRRRVVLPNRLLPYSAPRYPPTTAATAQRGIVAGNAATLERCPSKPAMEFARINAAETPEVSRASAHPMNNKSGLKNIPPPVPVRPDNNPIPTPEVNAAQRGMALVGVGVCDAVWRNSRYAA
jgi:hypothetical protein